MTFLIRASVAAASAGSGTASSMRQRVPSQNARCAVAPRPVSTGVPLHSPVRPFADQSNEADSHAVFATVSVSPKVKPAASFGALSASPIRALPVDPDDDGKGALDGAAPAEVLAPPQRTSISCQDT